MKLFRYLAYLSFAAVAPVFWVTLYILVLDVFPFPHVRACELDAGGCPPTSLWTRTINIIIFFGTIPATALAFVFFRRWIHKIAGLQNLF